MVYGRRCEASEIGLSSLAKKDRLDGEEWLLVRRPRWLAKWIVTSSGLGGQGLASSLTVPKVAYVTKRVLSIVPISEQVV